MWWRIISIFFLAAIFTGLLLLPMTVRLIMDRLGEGNVIADAIKYSSICIAISVAITLAVIIYRWIYLS